MEKIHGTSAHLSYRDGKLTFFSGGASHQLFLNLFDVEDLKARFAEIGHYQVTVYGEAYGGSVLKMSNTYGPNLKFIAFDVQIQHTEFDEPLWVSVPQAENVANKLGLEFVHYVQISTDLKSIDEQRDAESVQAIRNGMGPGKKREGVVLRPLIEVQVNNGGRICAKHKGQGYEERKNSPEVDAEKLLVLEQCEAIADEWVTPMRLEHVLDKITGEHDMSRIPEIIRAMVEDVEREAEGEIIISKEARKAIGKKAVHLFKAKLQKELEEAAG